jgi:5-formyltetrahydrofolate cyclo-ligase
MNKNSDLLQDCVESRLNFLKKGYYDRVNYKNSIKIGICFEEQIYNKQIKNDSFDIKMDKIITEKSIY